MGDASVTKVERCRAHAQPHLERERVVALFLAEEGLLRFDRALNQLLGERRSVVGAMWLVAYERQRTVETPGAQGLGCAQTREGGANDGDSAQHRGPVSLRAKWLPLDTRAPPCPLSRAALRRACRSGHA